MTRRPSDQSRKTRSRPTPKRVVVKRRTRKSGVDHRVGAPPLPLPSDAEPIYPNRLPEIVRGMWLHHGPRRNPPPDAATIRTLAEELYNASLSVEEQRPVRARVILASREELQKSPVSVDVTPFDEPRLFSAPELAKLAPAIDPDATLIAVAPRFPGRAGSRLMMWGLVPIGSTWSDAVYRGGFVMPDLPDALIVSATEPASLMFGRHQCALLAVRRGRLTTPSVSALNEGPLADFFDSSIRALHDEVAATISSANPEQRRSRDYGEAERYRSVLERLLTQIRTIGHGGAILFVPDDIKVDDARLANLISIKFPTERSDLWFSLTESVAHHAISHDRDMRARRARKGLSASDYKKATFSAGYSQYLERRLSDEIALVARLSGVDNAIVMTDRMRLLGFGGEIIANIDVPHVRVARLGKSSVTTRRSVERYGTRHRSAFRFCASSPFPSVAFIVSQDGGIKGVRQVGPQLMMWEEIATGEFAL